jgi:hypothetical protein
VSSLRATGCGKSEHADEVERERHAEIPATIGDSFSDHGHSTPRAVGVILLTPPE